MKHSISLSKTDSIPKIQLKQREAATETIRQLQQQSWPQRFTNIDQQIRDLQRRLEQQ